MKHLYRVRLLLLLVALLLGCGCFGQEKIQLTRNGKTAYSIIVDPLAPESVKKAANDLKSYFIKVTGASPEIVLTAQSPSTPFISLGTTSEAKAAGLDACIIPNDGFRIVTKGNNLFILGPDTPTGTVNNLGGVCNGTSNGVYTFIEDYLGVEWLMPGESGEEYTKVKSISIPDLDRTEYSPFNYRVVSARSRGPLEDEWDRHMKLGRVANVLHSHSWIKTIPPSYYDKHPDWFAQSGGKPIIPLGKHYKLETTNPALVQAFADVIIETFRKNPDQRWYSISPSDGLGFSDSPASMALKEKDPYDNFSIPLGGLSVSPLIIKFYNDVAKIVGKEFPDHKLGGYLYGPYRYPPAAGLPKLEPNLSLMLVSLSQHWKLHRPGIPGSNDKLMRMWGESAKKDGFDLYWYDYPISLMAPNGIITPPTPDHLNFIFSRLHNHGFKGAYIYGNPVWPVYGAGNYIIAKLLWNPDQDANKLLNNYCDKAFGVKAAPYIGRIYNILDTAFSIFYKEHLWARSTLTLEYLKEIYAQNYPEIELNYLKATTVKKNTKQKERLEMFGQVLSLMQWDLREYGVLPSDYKSPLTRSAEEIDRLMSIQHKDFQITSRGSMKPEGPFKVEEMAPLVDARYQKPAIVPVLKNSRMLLHVRKTGEVSITVRAFNGNNEFNRYTLTDAEGNQLRAGVIAEGRTIRFAGEAGENYFLDIPSRGASIKFEVNGASIAYKTWPSGFLIDGSFLDRAMPLYFYVPKNTKSFSITLGTMGVVVDIFSPEGKKAGQMKDKSRIVVENNSSNSGFWKIVVHKFQDRIDLVLDEQLPPWFIPDPAHPLKIVPAQ